MLDSRTDSNMDALLILKDMEERIRQEDCFGWDLYDALLSKWFKKGSILDHKYPRYVWSQVNKRFPFNLRKVMSVPATTPRDWHSFAVTVSCIN